MCQMAYIAEALWFSKKFNAQMVNTNIRGEKVIFIKPNTFMNLSGEAVRKYMDFYDIPLEDVLVIYDDLDMQFGKVRIKGKSSAGGHNGIKSIISHVKTQEFVRLKLGINNEYKRDVKNFVLAKFSKEEQKHLSDVYGISERVIDDFISGNEPIELMNKYN